MSDSSDVLDLRRVLDRFVIPSNVGRITQAEDCGTSRILAVIQDLYCHPEIQRNICKIIRILDANCHIKNVYLEGACGAIDTSWLASIGDKKIREEVIDSLITSGKLTGAEYYSVQTQKTNLLFGADDRQLHTDNLARLRSIIIKEDEVRSQILGASKKLSILKTKYFNKENAQLQHLLDIREAAADSSAGQDEYYSALYHYVDRFKIDKDKYQNLTRTVAKLELNKKIDWEAVDSDLRAFIEFLKRTVTYTTYRRLLELTGNFSDTEALCVYLARIAEHFPNFLLDHVALRLWFDMTRINRQLNPIVLIDEEKMLLDELRLCVAEGRSEREVVFLIEFLRYLEEYLSYAISVNGYEYVNAKIDEFDSLWEKYTGSRIMLELQPHVESLSEYYKINMKRSRHLLHNCSIIDECRHNNPNNLKKQTSRIGEARLFNNELATVELILMNATEVIPLVAGGFHTHTIVKELDDTGISWAVITPNVTGGTSSQKAVYRASVAR